MREANVRAPVLALRVPRHREIVVKALDGRGKPLEMVLRGFPARVVQHETDHLDGRLFIDRLTPTQLADISGELEEFEIDFESRRNVGEMPTDEQIAARIDELVRLRT